MSNINTTEEPINREVMNRTLKVLKILGEGYEVVKEDKGRITLSNKKENSSKNYIEFQNDRITISLDINNHQYPWHIIFWDNGSISEELRISNNKALNTGNNNVLNIIFFQTQQTTETSNFFLYNKTLYQKIYSDVNNIMIGTRKNNQTFPIADYYEVFTSYIESKKEELVSLTDNPNITDIIIKLFGDPIKQLVHDLTFNDQSYRFANELKIIKSQYIAQVSALTEEEHNLKKRLNFIEKDKDSKIKDLGTANESYRLKSSSEIPTPKRA